MKESLDAIGRRFSTDKSSGAHDFLRHYDVLFDGLRESPVVVLEFGVLTGQSLRTWSEYFPNGTIIGADINPDVRQHEGGNRIIEIADQSDVSELVRLAFKYGPFDIIIDDASHMWNHQIVTLQYMYSHVKPGGFYVIEDTHTSFGSIASFYKGNSDISIATYLNRFSDTMMGHKFIDLDQEPDAFLRTYAPRTSSITHVLGGSSILRRDR